jgi:hypothetical protein
MSEKDKASLTTKLSPARQMNKADEGDVKQIICGQQNSASFKTPNAAGRLVTRAIAKLRG